MGHFRDIATEAIAAHDQEHERIDALAPEAQMRALQIDEQTHIDDLLRSQEGVESSALDETFQRVGTETQRNIDRIQAETERELEATEAQINRIPEAAKKGLQSLADGIRSIFGFVFDLIPGSGILKLIGWAIVGLILFLILRPILKGLF